MLYRPFGDGSSYRERQMKYRHSTSGRLSLDSSPHSENYLKYLTSKHSFYAITVLLKPCRNSVLSEGITIVRSKRRHKN
jgi:hypothetical protein